MPAGVDVLVEDGFATIDFVDRATRGPGLAKLLEVTPASLIEKLTRSGPRALYRVPEGNAKEAGLLDRASVVDALDVPDTSSAGDVTGATPPEFPTSANGYSENVRTGSFSDDYSQGGLPGVPAAGEAAEPVVKPYDDGKPDADWSRAALNAYAAKLGLEPESYRNKDEILAAIREHEG